MTSSSSFAAIDRFVAALEYRIQSAIAQMTRETPPTIRCRFQQGRLLVLAEDTEAAASEMEREQRFQTLASAMGQGLSETELPEELLGAHGELSVRLYLRKRGTASPYADRSWGWKPADAVSELFDNPASGSTAWQIAGDDVQGNGALVLLSPRQLEDPLSIDEQISPPADVAVASSFWRTWKSQLAFQVQTWRSHLPLKSLHDRWRSFSAQWSFPWSEHTQALPWRSVGGLLTAGLAVGAIAYGVSRPCLVGSCERRQTASDLSQSAIAQMAGNPIPEQVNRAHQDLKKSVHLLAAIPPWSPHYNAAQAELMRYRTQLADLEWIIEAQKNATLASQKSQNPPHPVALWVEIHLLWQKAVAHLERIPDDSPWAAFVAQKRQEYAANYQAIGDRLMVEERAEGFLNEALEAGQAAAEKTEVAVSLPELVEAQSLWEKAISALGKIPKGTLAYEEARSHLSDYRTQHLQVRTRVTFENAGERAYQEALAHAAKAQTAAQKNQWTQAVTAWGDALAQMQQVSEGTLRYAEAQEQLTVYQNNLKEAQVRLKQAVALQTIEDDLQALCPVGSGVCTYSLGSQQIELTLRSPYDAAVRQSISPPSAQGKLNRSNSVIQETHELVQSVMYLGNRVQLPIILYDANRQLIARYKPEYGGFSKH